MRPPVTYPAHLADLILFADAAAELDAYKDHLHEKPDERLKIIAMICRMHQRIEQMAGCDADLIYENSDGSA